MLQQHVCQPVILLVMSKEIVLMQLPLKLHLIALHGTMVVILVLLTTVNYMDVQ